MIQFIYMKRSSDGSRKTKGAYIFFNNSSSIFIDTDLKLKRVNMRFFLKECIKEKNKVITGSNSSEGRIFESVFKILMFNMRHSNIAENQLCFNVK